MIPTDRRIIDWEKTGKTLELLRNDNIDLRRYVCRHLKHDNGDCRADCDKCIYEMDNHISRRELSEVFGTEESIVYNWERNRTPVPLEDMLFYAHISRKDLLDLLVFVKVSPTPLP